MRERLEGRSTSLFTAATTHVGQWRGKIPKYKNTITQIHKNINTNTQIQVTLLFTAAKTHVGQRRSKIVLLTSAKDKNPIWWYDAGDPGWLDDPIGGDPGCCVEKNIRFGGGGNPLCWYAWRTQSEVGILVKNCFISALQRRWPRNLSSDSFVFANLTLRFVQLVICQHFVKLIAFEDLTNEPGCFQLSAYNQPRLRHERGKRQFACLAQSMDRGAGNKIRWNDLRAFNISAFIDIGVGPHITCLHRVNSYLSFARVPGNPVRL